MGSSRELRVNWYDVGELRRVRSFLRRAIIVGSLEVRRQLEIG